MAPSVESTTRLLERRCRRALAVAVALLAACTPTEQAADDVGTLESGLSAAQCTQFAVGGKVKVCHATGSAKNPFVLVNVAVAGCTSGHAGHANDYVSVNGECNGAPLPPGSPCDATLECAAGYSCQEGTCQDRCRNVTCTASNQCASARCVSLTGTCVEEPLTGTACNDGDACTQADSCVAGTCTGADPITCTASSQCHGAGTCDPASGACSNPPLASGAACDDASLSTYADACNGAGTCGGTPVSCPANTACVSWIPNGSAQCTSLFAPVNTSCNDGNASTSNDRCTASGTCVGTACVDRDGDGYGAQCTAGPDCDDERRDVNPGSPEVCGNGLDDDCSGATTDACVSDPCANGSCGIGCADGQREGFANQAQFPGIAACSGGWATPGVFQDHLPTCNRNAGDDSSNPNGAGCTSTDLCAPGWHVCRTSREVATRAGSAGCGGVTAAGTFFAAAQSGNGCGYCSVSSDPAHTCTGTSCLTTCYPTSVQTNDVFGCGTIGVAPAGNCAPLNRFSNNSCGALPSPWVCSGSNGQNEALRVTKTGPAAGGVLCCVD